MRVTWWGHATATLTLGDVRVLTDPLFAARLAHLRRVVGPVPPPAARAADIAVVSHLHADHLHIPSLLQLAVTTRIVAPRGTRAFLRRRDPELARRIEEVDVGDVVTVRDVSIMAVPAHHDSRRRPGSSFRAPPLGYVAVHAGRRVWFAGDTGLFPGLAGIGPVDVAVLPVGGWGPTLGPEHLDPAGAAEAVARVGASVAVPVHWGTFWPAGMRRIHPGTFHRMCEQPGGRFAELVVADAHVLSPGSTVLLP